VLEKKPNIWKNISPSFKYLNFIFQSVTILGPIQVLANNLKKHDYNNLTFEVHANKLKNNVPKKKFIPIKSSTC
jgi:hypothetical protein